MIDATKPKVAVIYPFIPHYREAVFKALSRSNKYDYTFYGSKNLKNNDIELSDGKSYKFVELSIFSIGRLYFQYDLSKDIIFNKNDAYIFMSVPHYLTYWLYSSMARLFGRKVVFWTHGWTSEKPGRFGWLKNQFHGLAHMLFLYGNRARDIGLSLGVPRDKMHVIYNSLDYNLQKEIRLALETTKRPSALPKKPYILYIGRLIGIVQLELAIIALAKLRKRQGLAIPLVLIGGGVDRQRLERLATQEGVELQCLGALYDEYKIGQWIYHARAVVAPGKVGLTAMHAFAYGVPVITHSDFNRQMPEYEAIQSGVSGDFFAYGDDEDLADRIFDWISRPQTFEERFGAIEILEEKYTPERQVEEIEIGLDKLFHSANI